MTFSRSKPGGHATGERLLSTVYDALDAQIVDALDGGAGGTFTPSSPLSVAQLQCPTTPATGNAVANKTYADALDTAARAYTDTQLSALIDYGTYQPTISNLSNLGTPVVLVSGIDPWWIRIGDVVIVRGIIQTDGTNTSGQKLLQITLPLAPIDGVNFTNPFSATGTCTTSSADDSGDGKSGMVLAVSGAPRVQLRWYDPNTSDTYVHFNFSYRTSET